jgi:hypothetical protein
MEVGGQAGPLQTGKLFPVQLHFFLDQAEHPNLPGSQVYLRGRTIGQHRKLGAQELAGRHTFSPALVRSGLDLVGPLQAELRFQEVISCC